MLYFHTIQLEILSHFLRDLTSGLSTSVLHNFQTLEEYLHYVPEMTSSLILLSYSLSGLIQTFGLTYKNLN